MRIRRSRSARWAPVRSCTLFLLWALFLDVAHVIPSVGAEYVPFGDAVHMSKLGQMQFHRGQDTTYKRSSPIPQLRCVKGCEFEPAVVQCTNVKPRENKSKWRCETDLPRHLKFDETTIICEGFEYPTDNKVLKGSCGLEYSLTRTGWSPLQSQHYKHYMAVAEEDEMKGWTASWMIVIGVMLYLIHHNWRSFSFAVPGDSNGGIVAQVSRARNAWRAGTKLSGALATAKQIPTLIAYSANYPQLCTRLSVVTYLDMNVDVDL